MSQNKLLQRLTRGTRWLWTSPDYRAALPGDLARDVLSIESADRFHAKQGRSTARVRFDSPWGPLTVYLKRHYQLPWADRLRAMVNPSGRYTPAGAEWSHLQKARALGVPVPDAVAAGEWIGPWGRLQSFLMVAELEGQEELNVVLPRLFDRLPRDQFDRLERELTAEMAAIVARLHRACLFHKDLYLCHFFLDASVSARPGERFTLIDLHRLGEHRVMPLRWRLKDLGQLLYSTVGIPGITEHTLLRFWVRYARLVGLRHPRAELRLVAWKAGRYFRHNQP